MNAVVILVEDEELISTMIRLNLEQEGFQVISFAAAEPMLKHFQAPSAVGDIVLLDIMLPGISGAEALSKLRGRGVRLPVMMLTAKRDLETRVSTLDRGADDYLAKPFDVEELVARVKALLRRHRQASDTTTGD